MFSMRDLVPNVNVQCWCCWWRGGAEGRRGIRVFSIFSPHRRTCRTHSPPKLYCKTVDELCCVYVAFEPTVDWYENGCQSIQSSQRLRLCVPPSTIWRTSLYVLYCLPKSVYHHHHGVWKRNDIRTKSQPNLQCVNVSTDEYHSYC